MIKKINFMSLTITIMCFLLISSPYISQRINNIIKLLVEILVVIIFMHKNKIKKDDIKSCMPIIIFLIISMVCTLRIYGISTRLINSLITSGVYVIFFIIFKVYSRENKKEEIIEIVKKNIIFYSIVLDIFVIITLGKGLGGQGQAVYLIGNKFMLSYIHMLVLSLISYSTKNEKNILIYFIYSLILLKIADTTTGIIGVISLFLLIYLCNKNIKILNKLINPKILISFFLIINAIFLLVPDIYNISFIKEFFLKYSHTESMLSGRLVMYRICIKAIQEKFFLGHGLNCEIVKQTLGFGNPQNGILKLLLDYGLVGCVSFLIVIYTCFKKLNDSKDKKYKIMIVGFIYSMLICSLVEINLAAIFMLGLSLTNIEPNNKECTNKEEKKIKLQEGHEKMKRIGIMSMQRIINYGSFMQAYGLKKTIESLGEYQVEFVDYHIEDQVIEKKAPPSKIEKLKRKIKNILNIKRKINDKIMKIYYLKSIQKYLGITEEKNYPYEEIDELVIGSDEVFNCLQGYPVGFSRELFGKNYEKIPVISYAACFGNTNMERLKKYKINNEIKEMLSKFKKISVRDKNSYDIVKNLLNTTPEINLDPVLISDYTKEIIDNVKLKNYILIYAYPNRLTEEELKSIKIFAKEHNKKIITIGGYQKIADYNLVVDPFEVLAYFKHADYVITDTFHGSIFSIKTHAKFCTIVRVGSIGNNNKLIDLMNRLELENRIVNDITDIEKLYNEEMDYKNTDEIIKNETKKAREYLKDNLV